MSNITKTATIHASKTDTWNVIKDFGGVHSWHFRVESSPLLGARSEGLGAKRTCNFYDGTSVDEEITDYAEGERLTVALSNFAMPLKYGNATISVRTLGPDETEVTFSLDYEVKYGPVGWVMNSVMMQPMMGKMFSQILEGLNYHLVTGNAVGQEVPALPAAA